jgi:hypothetical protein
MVQKAIKVLFFALPAFLILSSSSSALACSCAKIATFAEEMGRAEVIFAGRVVEVDSSTVMGKAKFMVTQVWRGSIPPVTLTKNLTDCMDVFRLGEEYLVFAGDVRVPEDIERLGYQFVPSRCGQTLPIIDSQENLALLGPGYPPRSFTPEESGMQEESLWEERTLVMAGAAFVTVLLVVIIQKSLRLRQT